MAVALLFFVCRSPGADSSWEGTIIFSQQSHLKEVISGGNRMLELKGAKLERLRKAMVKARSSRHQQRYFYGVANARYILRKIFRLIEDDAKRFGIDPLAHQALIQIYGSSNGRLKIKEVAERLDISPAFSSNLIKRLVGRDCVKTEADNSDKRCGFRKHYPDLESHFG